MDISFERKFWRRYKAVIGVDEVGRGALAGPVVAAAVLLSRASPLATFARLVNDSKRLQPRVREEVYALARRSGITFGVGAVSASVIDRIGIQRATFLAMRRAVLRIAAAPRLVLVDGNAFDRGLLPAARVETYVKGDGRVFSIALASVIAKVRRDRLMRRMHARYPGYRFDLHKGYGTRLHYGAIKKLAPSPIHRVSFLHSPER